MRLLTCAQVDLEPHLLAEEQTRRRFDEERLAAVETAILLHPPLPLAGVQ